MRVLVALVILLSLATAESANKSSKPDPVASSPSVQSAAQASDVRVEGEKRFRTNCGRCHMAPHKFPPRMMGTIVRHMRVRALITDEDMRYILAYMTQ